MQFFFDRKFSAFIDEMESFVREEEGMEDYSVSNLDNIAVASLNMAVAQFGKLFAFNFASIVFKYTLDM